MCLHGFGGGLRVTQYSVLFSQAQQDARHTPSSEWQRTFADDQAGVLSQMVTAAAGCDKASTERLQEGFMEGATVFASRDPVMTI